MAPTPAPAWGRHLDGVDGLRALACALVLFGHILLFGGGVPLKSFQAGAMAGAGLTLFFVLSGFLLYRPFVDAVIRGENQPSTLRYFRNRALRILPAYWAILLLAGLVLGVGVLEGAVAVRNLTDSAATGYMTDPGLLLENLLLVQGYLPGSLLTGIGQAWSLAAEIVFYLLLPLLGLWAERLAQGRELRGRVLAGLAPVAALFVVGVVSRRIALVTSESGLHDTTRQWWAGTWHAVFARSFLAQADMFAFGMAAAVIFTLVSAGRLGRLRAKYVARATGGVFTVMILSVPVVRWYNGLWASTIIGAICMGLVLTVVLPRDPTPLKVALGWGPIGFFGLISYSVYLWHMPIIIWLRTHNLTLNGSVGALETIPLVFFVTLAASALTHRYVEAPAMKRKLKLHPTRRPPNEPIAVESVFVPSPAPDSVSVIVDKQP